MDIRSAAPPFRVGICAVDGFALLSYASTVEPLRAANLLGGREMYRVIHFGHGPASHSSGAAHVEVAGAIGDVAPLDLLIVVAGGRPELLDDPVLFRWLRQMAARGVPLAGVSGGPVLLTRAGVMRGHRMTVHWEHAAAMAEIAPDLLLERTLYVIDRDRMTCGGGTAPLDMMHALIAQQHGAEFARDVSDWFHHTEIRPSGGPQRSGLAERLGGVSPRVVDAVAAMERNVATPLSLDQLAVVAGITPRQVNRVFRAELGQSTMGYYRALRLDIARRLVVGSGLNMTEIALATGFSGSAHFATSFATAWSISPSEMRRQQRQTRAQPR